MIRDLISRIHTQSFECTSFKELYDKAKMPIVPLTIFGKTYHFIIDTGADLNLIRTSFANDLPEGFLYEIEGSNVTGAGGDINTSQGADLEVEFEGTGEIVKKQSVRSNTALKDLQKIKITLGD